MPNMNIGFASTAIFKRQNRFVMHIPDITHIGSSATRVYNRVLIEEKAARPKLSYKEKKYCNNFFKNQLAIDLFRDTVPPQILSADQVSMYFSIENRSPFLSHELFEYIRTCRAQ